MKTTHVSAGRKSAERVFGLAAAQAAFATRPDAVMSIAYTAALRKPLAEMLRGAARRRIAYREVEAEELARMAQSVHHEGVCLLVAARPAPKLSELLKSVRHGGLLLALDGVENPHNIGAILRSAAYFGAKGMIYTSAADDAALLPPAARRVAEGGAEYVPHLRVPQLSAALREARSAQIAVIGCDAHTDSSLDRFSWPERALVVLGHEQRGLSQDARTACKDLLRIVGTQHIDSLNVSVAAGIFLSSYAQAHGAGA
ncbi:MAG TPA: RNA methyltransferase [Polyangiales bacterium]|nr:RNA methyltransferase [Polyangiales bacterium]